ncbi:hypothetical protein BX616_010945, partial [Lobosporangium transversale]
LTHSVSYDFIEAEPAVDFMSALHTISLRKVTANNATFVEWSAEFSSDAQLVLLELSPKDAMANPSTQPPSNATTTNIIFGRDFVQSSYALLEVPKSLENYIDEHESRLVSFQVRGIEKDTAVLCTPTQTFSLQRAHTSNTLIPIAPVIGRKPESHNDMDLDDPYRTDRPDIEESSYGKHAVLDMMNSVLDLIPIPPRLDRLAELLGECLFEGWAHEHEVKGRLYTWRELQSTVQASDKEILQWLKDKHAKEINEILVSLSIEGMTPDAVDARMICKQFEESETAKETGIEAWMVEHCLESFSENEQESNSAGAGTEETSDKIDMLLNLFHKATETNGRVTLLICLLGIYRLSAGKRWRLDEFMTMWKKAVQDLFEPDLAYLAGECFVENERGLEKKQTITYIRYFPKSRLPSDPAGRFMALFEIKEKWGGQEIRPFLRDLVLDEKKLDVLLLKHARSVKQPGGGVIYSSRVIK